MNPKIIILVVVSLWFFSSKVFAQSAFATSSQWQVQAGTGAYAGEKQLGLGYISANERHQFELGYGWTLAASEKNVEQINLKYIYSPFQMSFRVFNQRITTNVAGLGIQISRWLDDRGYVTSPSQYPEEHYYAQTRYRATILFETHFQMKGAQLYLHSGLLDQWAIAVYNNPDLQGERYIWGSGFGLRWNL